MTDRAPEPCGARFFDESKRDLGRALQVSMRPRIASTLTVFVVAGAEPELARALSRLDRSRLWIQCEDAARTSYIFRWASAYGDGADLRIQGDLEPRTGREAEITARMAKAAEPPPPPPVPQRVPDRGPPSWDAIRAKRRW